MLRPCPKPYRERLKRGSVAWKRRVLEVFERDGYTCQWCGRLLPFEMLAPHHLKTVGAFGGDSLCNLVSLCKECHLKVHNFEIKLIDKDKGGLNAKFNSNTSGRWTR